MRITLLYFAQIREWMGCTEEVVEIASGKTPAELWQTLSERLPPEARELRPAFAVNETYVKAETALQEGDRLVFIPPVSGG